MGVIVYLKSVDHPINDVRDVWECYNTFHSIKYAISHGISVLVFEFCN